MSAEVLDAVERIDPEELRDTARRFLADRVERPTAIATIGADHGAALHGQVAELGWLLLTAPADRGGLGQSFEALAAIYEEMGRFLSPLTIAPSMAAVDILRDEEQVPGADLLDRIVAGEARVAIAFANADTPSVDQRFELVVGGVTATDLLLIPETDEGAVGLVDLRGAGVRVEPVETWDLTRIIADISLAATPVSTLAVNAAGATRIARAHLDLANAWDSIGGAEQALEEAIGYMGTRKQFGRPIGSFQALKHRAADLKVGLEVARALAHRASAAYAERGEGWADLAGQARLLATDSYRAITEESVQFHGGIGFTWEHDCHLFLKRALLNEILGGAPEEVRDRVALGVLGRGLRR